MTDSGHSITEQLEHNILTINTGLMGEEMVACYLMEHNGEAAIVETGNHAAADRIMAILAERGIAPGQVKYVIPTHAHLDHAGGAGSLMARLSEATLVAHPRAARHLIDPSKLIAGATAVYGKERFQAMYGEILPVSESRVLVAKDGDSVNLNGRQLLFRDTPGHANHHFCIWDELSRGWFTGDTFGCSYLQMIFPAGRLVCPEATPVQFDPDKLIASIDLLLSYRPARMYLTHYGALEDPEQYAGMLKSQINAYRELALQCREAESRLEMLEKGVEKITLQHARNIDPALSMEALSCLDLEMELNAKGLDVWVSRFT